MLASRHAVLSGAKWVKGLICIPKTEHECSSVPLMVALAELRFVLPRFGTGELRARPLVEARTSVGRRVVDLDAVALSGVPDPARVVEKGARKRHHVRLTAGDHLFGVVDVGDHADRAYLDVGRALHFFG